MATTPAQTITQSMLDDLRQRYGGAMNVAVGDPISKLVPAYMGLQPGQYNADDPTAQMLMQAGFLGTGSTASGDTTWTGGSAWSPAPGMLGGSSFTDAPRTPYQLQLPTEDFKFGGWKNQNFGAADPTTGLQKFMSATPYIEAGSWWDKLDLGPIIGAAVGAGMGGLGFWSDLGPLGSTLFKGVGSAILGNNPFAGIQSLFGGGGGGQQAGSGQQMTPQQMQQFLPFLILLSQLRGGGNG